MRICLYTAGLLLLVSSPLLSQDTSRVATGFSLYYQKGLELQRAGNFPGAIEAFEQALRVLPENFDARVQLAYTLSWNGEYRRGEEEFRTLLRQDPVNFDARLGLAQTLLWQKEYQRALQEFRLLHDARPGHGEVLRGMGQIYFWLRDFEQAARYFESAVSADPVSAEAHLNLADSYYEMKEWSRALGQYELAVRLDSTIVRAREQVRNLQTLLAANEVDFYANVELFSEDDRTPHSALTVRYGRRLEERLRLEGTSGYVRKKFGDVPYNDAFVGAALAYRLSPQTVLSTGATVAPGAEVIPRLDFHTEVSQTALARTELTLSYRIMEFENVTVNVVSPGLVYYFSDDAWAILRVYGAFSDGANPTDALFGRLSYKFSPRVAAWLGLAEGSEVIRGLSLENLRNLSSRSYFTHVDYSPNGEVTLLFDYQYGIRRGFFIEHAIGFGARYRW